MWLEEEVAGVEAEVEAGEVEEVVAVEEVEEVAVEVAQDKPGN